jgi:hypothetical protein
MMAARALVRWAAMPSLTEMRTVHYYACPEAMGGTYGVGGTSTTTSKLHELRSFSDGTKGSKTM